MLRNYLKIAIRNLKRNKLYSVINIAGLSVGLAAFILIVLYVRYENSYENFIKDNNQIYQVLWITNFNNNPYVGAIAPDLLAPAIKTSFPQIKSIVRVWKTPGKLLITYKNKRIYDSKIFHADPNFFNMFNFHFVAGDPSTVLSDPNSVVITQKMAMKYFGSANPLGKIIKIGTTKEYVITGVVSKIPSNTQFQFNFLVHLNPNKSAKWYDQHSFTYVKLRVGTNPSSFSKKLTSFAKSKVNKSYAPHISVGLEPLTKIHMSGIPNEPGGTNPLYVFIFSAIGFLILIIACVNYMNLATARFSERAKELSVRKLLGAGRRQLVFQLLGEALLLSSFAMILALFLVELLLPSFNRIAQTGISPIDHMVSMPFLVIVISILIVTTLISGLYPAIYLTKHPLTRRFSTTYYTTNTHSAFRKSLVVLQFVIAIGIIIGSIIIERQLNFINNKPLGFQKKNILIITDNALALKANYQPFKQKLLQYPDIKMVTSGAEPVVGNSMYMNASIKPKGQNPIPLVFQIIDVDYDYLKTMGIKLIKGRSFSEHSPEDPKFSLLINQEFVRILKLKHPLGKQVLRTPILGKVIGVIQSYNNQSLYHKTGPLLIRLNPGEHQNVIVRFQSKDLNLAIQQVKKVWHEYVPDRPLLYSFLNNDLNNLYSSDQRLASIFLIFSFLAIFLACLGLFGLVAFSVERRTKEIGIRKVNGASVWNIVRLLVRDFLILVGIGFLIAVPIAWYAMHRWLQNFAYHIHIGIWVFLLAGVLAMLIALAAVSWQSIRAALANPVESLRNE